MDDAAQESPATPQNIPGIIRSSLNFPVVGLGASAGGLNALMRFFEGMPSDAGMAFVVVMHLAPQHRSHADSILQRSTRMPVVQVLEPTRIERNHVYVIPPGRHLEMSDSFLYVRELKRPVGQHIAIDLFFRTLADAHRERAIGIVLSGTGADGTAGIGRLKEQGGLALAQLPDDAEHPGMPLAAIGTGDIDFVLPVAEMPQKLIDLWRNSSRIELPSTDAPDAPVTLPLPPAAALNAEEALQDVIAILRARTGHDFRHYKRATMLRRIERRLQVRSVPTLPEYRDVLHADPEENVALLKDMLIGVTNFFRDREAFEALEREAVPQVFAGKREGEQVRAWVAACSTGEEAYSVAMLFCEQAALMPAPPEVQVFATDIDERSIATARAGIYPSSILTDVPPTRLREHFAKEEAAYRIKKSVRDRVLFASHNLLRDPPFSRLDLITCRNLLIYLNREMQEQVLEMFHFALNPGGFLLLGSSESAEVAGHYFTVVDKKNRIYRAKSMSRTMRSASVMPALSLSRSPLATPPVVPGKRKLSFAEVHQRVLARHAPPSVLINHESAILYISDRVGRFLRHVGGEPSHNLVALVHPELRLELRTALFQAAQSGKSVEARRVFLKRDERGYYVNMLVRPFHDDEAGIDLLLVLFDEVEAVLDSAPPAEGQDSAMLSQLESELQRTKEQLQETIEHSETSTEELRASNEELQAINEELRSATEELETSKEELQSVNEELVTVNYELKMKVEETGQINDDLNNLIASTDIATVFIDRGMRIKR
ncbi:MAG: CheR family methyltransferase, partial [Burkholderiaceae bacterium]